MPKMDMGLATRELDMFVDDNVKDILDLHPWMQDKTFKLLTERQEIENYIYSLIENGIAALDLETTSLNTRVINGEIVAKLVGICLAPNANESAYIPVGHEGYDDNVSYDFAVHMLKLLCLSDCRLIFHNFKYDGQVLYNHGIKMLDPDQIEDTLLMAAVEDASRKNKRLKYLSEHLLERPMLEISNLGVEGSKKKVVSFTDVSPKKAVIYGGSDAMNTFALFEYLSESLNKQDPNGSGGPWLVYNKIEKRAVFPVMEMERNLVKMNRKKLEAIRDEIHLKVKDCVINIYKLAGREFDIASGKQLGEVLFDEMGVRYPEKEKNDNGTYKTDEKVLEKIKDESPLVQYVLNYRSYQKTLSTYVNNFLKNMDDNDEVKFQLNQVKADTGRFSASGGAGLAVDGYSGVNCQNISKYNKKDPTSFDLRDCVEAHEGFKIVAIDYSGEELRIATNLSKEPKWVEEFNNGTGDIHSITGRAIHGREKITKEERGIGKTLNFLTLYGGGALGFSQQAKIPLETAKKMQYNFFKSLPGLKKWIDLEAARSRKRGYSKTAFGRRRNLSFFYESTDRYTKSQGDRRAVNSAVQGTGADVIKIALYRVWKWIYDNGYENEVKILMPVHDEIVFEIKGDWEKLDYYIPELVRIMKLDDLVEKLGWDVYFELDAEFGDTWKVEYDYYKIKAGKQEYGPAKDAEQNEQFVSNQISDENVTEEMSSNANPSEEGKEEKSEEVSEKIPATMNPAVNQPVQKAQPQEEYEQHPITLNDSTVHHFVVTIRDQINKKANDLGKNTDLLDTLDKETDKAEISNGSNLLDRVDSDDYFVYPISKNKLDFVISEQFATVLRLLVHGNDVFVGPKKRIKLKLPDGQVAYVCRKKVSIDAFVFACTWLNI